MPFDGSSVSQELLVLRALVDFFDAKDRWIRGELEDRHGRACLVGALRIVRRRLGVLPRQHTTRAYLASAIHMNHGDIRSLQKFNDDICANITELRDTIRLAYLLAGGDLKDLPPMPAPIIPYPHNLNLFAQIGRC
jgi:hypothetical protein